MSTGQIVGGVVGAIVGFVATGFNPYGAFQGAVIGAGIGGYLDPPKGPTIQGPRLSDLAVQTSTYGNFIPRVYGTIGIHGNLLWLENNQLKETVRKKKQGGKGGGSSTTVKTYSYSGTTILALCQGPIAGIRRIWCMDKLIYNAGSDDLETIIASNQAASGWKLYLGTDDQMPDPRYEADVGVGNASAFRGIAYLAFYDFQLADYSNTLQAAQFKVEVVTLSEESITTVFQNTMPAIGSADIWGCGGVDSSGRVMMQVMVSGIITVYKLGASGRQVSKVIDLSGKSTLVTIRPFTPVEFSYRFSEVFGPSLYVRVNFDGEHFHSTTYSPTYFAKLSNICVGTNQTQTIAHSGFNEFDNILFGIDNSQRIYNSTIPEGVAVGAGIFGGQDCILSRSVGEYVIYRISVSGVTPSYTELLRIPTLHTWAGIGDGNFWSVDSTSSSTTSVRIVSPDGETVFSGDGPNVSSSAGFKSLNYGILVAINHVDASTSGAYNISPQTPETLVSDIIASEMALSGLLGQPDIDVSLIDSTVAGYRVSGGTIRSAIEPLQGAFPFDVIQSGYQIKCVPRGQSSVMTIPWEDLGATDGDEPGDILRQSREMDSQLPARTTIKYLDAAREYATSEQYAERINTEAINRVDRELPLVLTADQAAGVAEVLQGLAWLERSDLSFTLPPTYLALEPADVVTVTTPQASYQLRITDPNYTPDGRLECKAKPSRAALYTPNATGGEGVAPTGTVPLAGESIFLALDIPVVDETLQNDVGFVGVMTGTTDGWPGALLVRSNDAGQTWTDLQGFNAKATLGTARGTLPSSSCTLIDQRTLTVDMISGELESVTRDQMLAGVNYAAYGVDGRWEIVRFQNAQLQGGGSNLVSGFVRGERGTEWATGLHAAGDYFVLLDDPDNIFIGSPVESIGLDRLYRGVTSGASVDSASDVSFAYQGVNLECLSPVYAKGSRDGSSNFTGTFTRRSRLSSSWWTTGVEAPLGETTQAYEIDVMNGSTVVRTITASTPTFAYSATNQATDFGSPQASITFRIYQLSATVGRGLPLEVTL